jgi:hypothetical protein
MSAASQTIFRVASLEEGLKTLSEDVSRLTQAMGQQTQGVQHRLDVLESGMKSMTENVDRMARVLEQQSTTFQTAVDKILHENRCALDQHNKDNRQEMTDLYNRIGSIGKPNWQALAVLATTLVAFTGFMLAYIRLNVEPVKVAADGQAVKIEKLERGMLEWHESKGSLTEISKNDRSLMDWRLKHAEEDSEFTGNIKARVDNLEKGQYRRLDAQEKQLRAPETAPRQNPEPK